ncbi:MAG: hypothetical protein EBT22_06170 [Chloroflexi bacterium]|nr:hypothetical protein [Chloroflexota bacterium]
MTLGRSLAPVVTTTTVASETVPAKSADTRPAFPVLRAARPMSGSGSQSSIGAKRVVSNSQKAMPISPAPRTAAFGRSAM